MVFALEGMVVGGSHLHEELWLDSPVLEGADEGADRGVDLPEWGAAAMVLEVEEEEQDNDEEDEEDDNDGGDDDVGSDIDGLDSALRKSVYATGGVMGVLLSSSSFRRSGVPGYGLRGSSDGSDATLAVFRAWRVGFGDRMVAGWTVDWPLLRRQCERERNKDPPTWSGWLRERR